MTNHLHRRTFLQHCGLATVAVATVARPNPAVASEPIARNGNPKFKFSLAAYSYRNLLTGDKPELSMFDFVEDCARMQLEGTEPTSYFFPNPVTREFLVQLKQRCFQLGLDVSGTAVGNDFGHPPGERRQSEIDGVKQWIEFADILGAPVIRVFAGYQQEGISAAETRKLMVSGLEECCDYAGQHGVHLALENHGGPTTTADALLSIVRDVRSPWFGVNLDTGNFHGQDVYADIAAAAPYSLNVQIKMSLRGAEGNMQPADFPRLASILRDAGYRGYIVLEYEEDGDPRVACPAVMEELREAFL